MSACKAPARAPIAPARTELRGYQRRAIEAARKAYREGARALLLVSPTGSGKTTIAAEIMRKPALAGGGLFLAHRDELITQARARMLAEGFDRVGIVAAGYEPDPGAAVQVAMTPTLLARDPATWPRARVVVLDEAHHAAAEGASAILRHYRETSGPDAVLVGLTATPERTDGRALGIDDGGVFDSLIQVAQVRELQALGHLVPVVTLRPPSPQGELAARPVDAYLEHCPGERAFVFCSHGAHARRTAAEFLEQGVPAAVIDERTKPDARRAILEAFRAGEILALCNVYTMTEGVDVPAASVVILARGCGSAAMFMQMGGRAMRPSLATGKTRMLLIDLRGAVYQHGLLEADRIYSLSGKAIALAGDGEQPLALATCKACGACFEAGPRECPRCKATAPPLKMPKVKAALLGTIGRIATKDEKRAAFSGFIATAKERGYNPHWASHQYRNMFGVWPVGVR